MMALLQEQADPKGEESRRWAEMRIHRVTSDMMTDLGYSSKLNAEWEFLTMLRDEGRRAAEAFYAAHKDDLGKRSSLDIAELTRGV